MYETLINLHAPKAFGFQWKLGKVYNPVLIAYTVLIGGIFERCVLRIGACLENVLN